MRKDIDRIRNAIWEGEEALKKARKALEMLEENNRGLMCAHDWMSLRDPVKGGITAVCRRCKAKGSYGDASLPAPGPSTHASCIHWFVASPDYMGRVCSKCGFKER